MRNIEGEVKTERKGQKFQGKKSPHGESGQAAKNVVAGIETEVSDERGGRPLTAEGSECDVATAAHEVPILGAANKIKVTGKKRRSLGKG